MSYRVFNPKGAELGSVASSVAAVNPIASAGLTAFNAVAGLFGSTAASRARKIASDIATAQARLASNGGNLAAMGDADYLMFLFQHGQNVTRQEYDLGAQPFWNQSDAAKTNSGYFPASHPIGGQVVTPSSVSAPSVNALVGQLTTPGSPAQAGLAGGLLGIVVGAVALLAISKIGGRRA